MGKSASEIEAGIRSALMVCSLEACGLWCKMRYLIDESDRPGHLRQNGKPMSDVQLARAAGSTSDVVSPLLQELDEAGLLERSERTWHSPALSRLAKVRADGARRVQEFRERNQKPGWGRSARKVLRNTGCNAGVTPDVTRAVPPASSSLPGPLSPTPPTSGIPDAAHPGGGAAGGDHANANGARSDGRAKRERKLTDEQNDAWCGFRDWWTFTAWPSAHQGEQYPFGDKDRGFGADGPKSIAICRKARWDLELIKRVALAFLDEPEVYGNYDHKLSRLDQRFNQIRRALKAGGKGRDGHQHQASTAGGGGHRDGFSGARRSIPDVVAVAN